MASDTSSTPTDSLTPRTQLARRRAELGLTLEELARAAGLSFSTVIRAEHGQTRPNRSTMWLLASALDCEPGELEGSEGPG